MLFSVQTNVDAMKNLANQFWINRDMQVTMERLSSGMRINRGADDPAGLAISEGMRAHTRGIDQALENTQEAMVFLNARDRIMAEQQDIGMRLMELAVRAANEATLTTSDMQKLDDEAQALITQLDTMGKSSSLRGSEGTKLVFNAGQLDVIWVIDQTGSMGAPIASVVAGAPNMYSQLAAKGFDLRMGAVGYGVGAVGNLSVTAPPGSPFNALTATGSKSLQGGSAGFVADVNAIAGALQGSRERGLDASLEAIYSTGIQAQLTARPDAQRVMILLTDADSDDFGEFGANNGINVGQAERDFVVSTMDSWGMSYYVVSTITEGAGGIPADADYTDIATRVASGGGSMALDGPGAWVNTITSALEAFGGPYSLSFQIGADNVGDDKLELNFKTVTARTSGLSSVSLTSATAAQNSIDQVKAGIEFISEERAATGAYMHRMESVIDDLTAERNNTLAAKSNIADTDFAETASGMTKQQIIFNTAVAAGAQANATPSAVLNLISEQGIGQQNDLL